MIDINVLVRTYLTTSTPLTDPLIFLVGSRIYCPRLPENADLPAIGFFVHGGRADANVTTIISPSIQFDCWADNPITARKVYRALYDALQGIGNTVITIGGIPYCIIKVREEVQGQDLQDVDIPNFYRVITFYSITVWEGL
jgi:hypothetical protein